MADSTQPDFSAKLRRFPIFDGLSDEKVRAIRVGAPEPVRRNTMLFKQGSPANRLFLVLEGEIKLTYVDEQGQERLVRLVQPYEVLGRLELDTLEGQLGTARTTKRTRLLIMDKVEMRRLRNSSEIMRDRLDRSRVIGHLRSVPYFAPLSDFEIKWFADVVLPREIESDEILYHPGDAADRIFIMRQGRVRLQGSGPDYPRWVSAGAVFGDRSVAQQSTRLALAVAETPCRLYTLPDRDLRQLQIKYPKAGWGQDAFSAERVLSLAPLFADLKAEEMRKLSGYTMRIHLHRTQSTIARQGVINSHYYVFVRGRAVSHAEDKEGREVARDLIDEEGTAFGEAGVINSETFELTVESLTATDWVRIHRLDLDQFLEDNPDARERLTIRKDIQERAEAAKHRIAWQQDGESILIRTRRHWIVLVRNMIPILGVLLLLLILYLGLSYFLNELANWLLTLAVVLLLAPVTVWTLFDYLNDFHNITNRRILHEEKVILLYERRSEAPLDKIQDTDLVRPWWAKLLGYADVKINTAAEIGAIHFDYLPGADEALAILDRETNRAKAGVRATSQSSIRKQLQSRLQIGLEEQTDERALIGPPLPSGPYEESKGRSQVRFAFQPKPRDEHEIIWRKHWLGLLALTIIPFLTTVAAFIIFLVVAGITGGGVSGALGASIMFIAVLAFFASLGWMLWNFADWRNDHYIVTDQHIEHLEMRPLWLDEIRKRTSMERVENVAFRRPGPLAFIFDYGDVVTQTAATEGQLIFRYVPNPSIVQQEIFYRMERYQERLKERQSKEIENDLADWIATYHELSNGDHYGQVVNPTN
ncbi:MAG: cyclic nucleotide-binding domain-containing protein [Chloroflexi bacterium]|nr:cyclic nucleotide-binding domain-containing protein [Chloroflexota bacterium]